MLIDANKLILLDKNTSLEIAAAYTLQGLTAQYLLHESWKLEPGQIVLVHAAAGGVGLILSQWAKHIGATVIGTVGTEEKAEYAKKNGCDYTILYSKQDFSNKVKELTEGQGVNVIYDAIGKDTFNKGLTCLAERGRIVCYGFASGPIEPVDISRIRPFSGSIATGALLTYTKNHIERQKNADQLFNLINKAVLKININQKYSLEDAEVAHRELAGRKTIGSSVLIPLDGRVVGYGTYFGIILVLLRSVPTTEQPLGTMTPPSTELYLYSTLLDDFMSKLELESIGGTLV